MEFAASPRSITASLIHATEAGDEGAVDQLVAHLYDELREMARRQLGRERRTPTLHTTELVHEVYLKLVDDGGVSKKGRAYFFGAAARAMRRVLIDSARRRTADKRGGGAARISLSDADLSVDAYATELLDIDRALTQLEQERPRLAQVVELRFFGGLDVEEAAATLEVSPRTVKSDWALARAWLFTFLHGDHLESLN